MAFKEWFRRLQPVQLYLVLFFTSAFFILELITSHITHALTLLVNAYHMLCNIIALIGCIASIKYSNQENYDNECRGSSLANSAGCIITSDENSTSAPSLKIKQSRSNKRMMNTFGWARINILTMLVCCVFLGAFCFSLQVEALQTLVHIDHMDAMHNPLVVLCIGATGILLNAFCYILIGGYTFYHGSSLQVTADGEVIIRRNARSNGEQISTTEARNGQLTMRLHTRQGVRGMFRDILGCVFVMIVSILVHYTDPQVAKFVDPVIAIISSTSLFVLSYPYMKESGLILLQTIPNHININSLKKELLEAFPGIVNVHDLHVWQLTGEKIISTAHIIFLDPTVYADIKHQVTAFFVEIGVTQVTIQPEFHKIKPSTEKIDCLIRCQGEKCVLSQCCSKESTPLDSRKIIPVGDTETQMNVSQSAAERNSPPISFKRFTVHSVESPNDSYSREETSGDSISGKKILEAREIHDDANIETKRSFDINETNKSYETHEVSVMLENNDNKIEEEV